MFLSFIIPIYNCEQYIRNNLNILIGSPLAVDDYEILLIDDGSKDGSSVICHEYDEKWSNIHYFYQQNQGPATARNTGLNHAQGDYIWFVDADDRINPDFLVGLKSIVETESNVDLVAFGYVEEYSDRQERKLPTQKKTFCSGLEYLQSQTSGSYLWNHIYRRKAIGKVRMLDGVSHIEDYCFNRLVVTKLKKVMVLPEVGYYYNRYNQNSISHRRHLRDRVKANVDSLRVYQVLSDEIEMSEDEGIRFFLRKDLNFAVNAHLYTMMLFDNVRTVKRYLSKYKEMGFYPMFSTGNSKADAFRLVANEEWLLLSIVRIGGWLKKIRNR